jgi:hypothetical protein
MEGSRESRLLYDAFDTAYGSARLTDASCCPSCLLDFPTAGITQVRFAPVSDDKIVPDTSDGS